MSLPTVIAEGRHTDMPILLMLFPVIRALADQNGAGTTQNNSVLFKAHQQPAVTFSSADTCCDGQEHPPCSAWVYAWVLSSVYFWKHVQVYPDAALP